MSADFHIKFDGVTGEATHKEHKGETEVLSWNWGVNNQSSISGGGSGKGRASPAEFHFTHKFDKASPVLAKQCASGKHFKEVTMVARKSGEGQKEFLKIVMKEVFITSVQSAGVAQGDLMENVSMSYADVEFIYKPQDDKGGTGGDVKFGWNIKTTETR